jgi:trimeric autotransporter adhesin
MQHIQTSSGTIKATKISSSPSNSSLSSSSSNPHHHINTNNNLDIDLKDILVCKASKTVSVSLPLLSPQKLKVNYKQVVSTTISMGNKLIQNVGAHTEKSNSNDLEEESPSKYLNHVEDLTTATTMSTTNSRSPHVKMSPKDTRLSSSSESNISSNSSSSSSSASSSNSSPIPFDTKLVISPKKSTNLATNSSIAANKDETSVVTDSGFTDAPTTSSSCSSELSSCGSSSESHSAADGECKTNKKTTKKQQQNSNNTSYSSDTSNSNLEHLLDVDAFSAKLNVESKKDKEATLAENKNSASSLTTIVATSITASASSSSSSSSNVKASSSQTKKTNDAAVVLYENEIEEDVIEQEDNEEEDVDEDEDDDDEDEDEDLEEQDEYEDEEIGGEKFKLLVQRKSSNKNKISKMFAERNSSSKSTKNSNSKTAETATTKAKTTSSSCIVPYASMTASSISYNNNNSEFSSEFAIPPRLEYLLDMPMCAYETQVQHSWNPDDRSLNIFVKEADPLTLHRHPVAQSTDCIRTKMGEKNFPLISEVRIQKNFFF